MIAGLIRACIANRVPVLLGVAAIAAWGIWAMLRTPLDAIPDLSDVQVIIRTTYPGQAPEIVETQVTYPLATTMLSVPGARTVRGYSMFGDSFVYVLFEDGTDLYWARSRVLEYLNQVQARLPKEAKTALGPDATGVGWIYEYALIDESHTHDVSQLRALQDWFLKYELKSVPNVAEVASLGGMVRQYQVVVDPQKLRAFNITHAKVVSAIRNANQETGGSVLELAEAEYMVRASGYLKTLEDFRSIPLATTDDGIPVRVGDVATVQIGPEVRRGITDLNGDGEVAGGVIIMRSGKNALETINAVKVKLAQLKASLPPGVEIVPTYDRSELIKRAIENLRGKLIEELVIVAVVCAMFLSHLRSALVAIVSLPLGILVAFLVMHYQGINANIMSLGGIAIAIGAMVDAAIVMIENAHKHIEAWHETHPRAELQASERWQVISHAAVQVGPALFTSLLVITFSFIPVFTLQAQEGRLFAPLAFTKTYSMAAAAGLAVTLIPVLMGYLIRGQIPKEHGNPINRALVGVYRPLLRTALAHPRAVLAVALLVLLATAYPATHIGAEFMPPLDEGDVLYMPSALPGISPGKVTQLLQQTDRLIKTVPEVASVFGKVGRAETATDPAPLEMFETTIQFKPRSEWRAGMTPEKLVQELDQVVQVPGLTNIWVPPIRNRIDMLATGIKSPIGVKIAGADLQVIDGLARQVEAAVRNVPGVTSAFAERLTGGRYVDVNIDRERAARYGLNISDVQSIVAAPIGGEEIGETVEGLQRFPISVRYPRELRDSLQGLRDLPILTDRGAQIRLGDVAEIRVADGPSMIKSENARLSGWVYVDLHGRPMSTAVREMQQAVARAVRLPSGYSISWSGQFEYLVRATERLKLVVPATLGIIFVLLYLTFRRFSDAALIMATLPFALVGGYWLMFLLGYNMSVASAVGFIALGGVAAEIGIIMLVYLNQAVAARSARGRLKDRSELDQAIVEGAALRIRPVAMTVAVIIAGLLPIMWGSGTGSEVMRRIAAPMVGGMITALLLSMLVIPSAYSLIHGHAKAASGVS
ncbi:MAG: efflux RND transporter permease subunit [Gammaproteobacteria bacterium]|nr:MAG: efflux RND transporter permease subunit [Gammaproteobacteria bacterium]